MPQFVIESETPGAVEAGGGLEGASQASCFALRDFGPPFQWGHSYVTNDNSTASSDRVGVVSISGMPKLATSLPTAFNE